MLSSSSLCSNPHLYPLHFRPPNPNSNPLSNLFHKPNYTAAVAVASAALSDDIHPEPRKHNSKSAALLSHYLSSGDSPNPEKLQPPLPEEEKVKLLELSLVTKRTPQFPGSIYVQSPSHDSNVDSSLQSRFRNGGSELDVEDDRRIINRALEIRRKVTSEILKEAMRKGKFGITYATNLLAWLPDFIDFVMIQAASMKQSPEFSRLSFSVRAKTVIEDSNVVPLIRWLKHNSLSYPQIGKLICMSRGKLESIRRLVEWLKGIHVKGGYLGLTLTKAGGNILERSNEELDEIVDYLESNGVRMVWMGFVMSRCPYLLSYSMEELRTRVEFFLNMGMNERDFGTMVFDYPKVLGHYTVEDMNRKVNYLKEFGVEIEDVGKLLAYKPQLMNCSIEDKWKPLVKYFYYLGISKDGLRRMLTIKPVVFCLDLETIIVPKVQFFKDIGVQDDGISNMLVKFPSLLTYSLYKKIRPVVIFLMTKAGVREKDIGKVIALGPELFGYSIVHKLEVNLKYFLSLGINAQKLGEMIADFPMLLRYNIDILRPKYQYLRRTMVRPLQDLIDFPRFFSYSLDGRIIPRHQVLVENRMNFNLRSMLACTDEEFKNKVADIVEKRQRFESGNVDGSLSTVLTTSDLIDSRTPDDFSGENEE
ncbi:transcription termination factor MTERF2, chloroplastic [Momordica charantia]|uniref:Transcription termination factor MTERF2, chloroplastic n=1 Tax=Momordica charantia TaxID=3673 RepID=A0A6J1C6I5_MOMCH|nr:transcription termination factor MTERF2, chloroplastic [Momordica charantia]XP_022136044.1 transcription termination factor MTERF2, chloroplastic [Momordica charantia]